MKIRPTEVVILCGGDLDDDQRRSIAAALVELDLGIAGFITEVSSGAVTGTYDGVEAFHNIYAPPRAEEEV